MRDFKAAIDYLLTPLTPTATKPVTPSVPRYTTTYQGYGDGDNTSTVVDPLWVAYDQNLIVWEALQLDATKAVAEWKATVASKVDMISRMQAEGARLTSEIEKLYATRKSGLEKFITAYVNSRGVAKSSGSPDGLIALDPDRIVEDRFYIATYVSDWDEESAPSPVSDLIVVDQTDGVDITVGAAPAGRNIVKWRLYRSNTGSSTTTFQLVDEMLISNLTYKDLLKGSQLQEPCPTLAWLEPPYRMDTGSASTVKPVKGSDPYLKGLVGMPNGIMAGFIDNYVAFCEPYAPYAWPVEYQITTEYPIVGMGSFGQTLFVGTLGTPYLISGSDSASMSAVKLDAAQACSSRRSIVSAQGGVFYASPDGLCFAGGNGVELITQALFSREDWQKLDPKSIVGASHEGVYYFWYSGSGGGSFALDTTAKKLVQVDMVSNAVFSDPLSDGLYYCQGGQIKRAFSSGRRTGKWKSGLVTELAQSPLAWLQVDGDMTAANPATVRWYGDGVLRYTATVTSITPQRLPPGRYLEHEVEIESSARVTKVMMTSTTEELKGA